MEVNYRGKDEFGYPTGVHTHVALDYFYPNSEAIFPLEHIVTEQGYVLLPGEEFNALIHPLMAGYQSKSPKDLTVKTIRALDDHENTEKAAGRNFTCADIKSLLGKNIADIPRQNDEGEIYAVLTLNEFEQLCMAIEIMRSSMKAYNYEHDSRYNAIQMRFEEIERSREKAERGRLQAENAALRRQLKMQRIIITILGGIIAIGALFKINSWIRTAEERRFNSIINSYPPAPREFRNRNQAEETVPTRTPAKEAPTNNGQSNAGGKRLPAGLQHAYNRQRAK